MKDLEWLGYEEAKARVNSIVAINQDNIHEEMANNVIRGVTISALLAHATAQVDAIELEINRAKGNLFHELKAKKCSEAHIRAAQDTDENIFSMREVLVEAQSVKAFMTSADRKYSDRANMLINLKKLQDAEAS